MPVRHCLRSRHVMPSSVSLFVAFRFVSYHFPGGGRWQVGGVRLHWNWNRINRTALCTCGRMLPPTSILPLVLLLLLYIAYPISHIPYPMPTHSIPCVVG